MSLILAERAISFPTISSWPQYPRLYEINIWVWLCDLSRKYRRYISLSSVPANEWDAIAAFGFDAVWLMGVWERSPAGITIASQNKTLLDDFHRALPDFRMDDNVGSPYCVRRYGVDEYLGGPEGLSIARTELSKRGMNLILDFVPNHVAPDHSWVFEHSDYFIPGNASDLKNDPSSYMQIGQAVCARGRDPYFPAWPDVLQLNAFSPGLRQVVVETIISIAEQCDGVRCDMAMLFLDQVFERTWGSRAGPRLRREYWADVISAVKGKHPGFLFIAEAYWDLEWELQRLGFDFCYDKRLYDRLEHSNAESIRLHLSADLAYQSKLVRFIENHDEARAAASFSAEKERAVSVIIATLPGMKLFHEGQFDGRKVRLPVFLGRRPDEPEDRHLHEFYSELLQATNRSVFHNGRWAPCERTGWPDNVSFQNLLAWSWIGSDYRYLVVVNFSEASAQGHIELPWPDVSEKSWLLVDLLSGARYLREANEMAMPGLYVELAGWNYHFFECLVNDHHSLL